MKYLSPDGPEEPLTSWGQRTPQSRPILSLSPPAALLPVRLFEKNSFWLCSLLGPNRQNHVGLNENSSGRLALLH